jgi:adenylate cyclase
VAVVLILASLFSGELTKLIRDDDQIRLAILPFDISEIPSNQKYLASSMQDDLIVDMARIDKLLVLATNSTEQFKNGIQEQEKIFKLLNPHYILVTKARSSGEEIKIISQLIDENGSIAWAENYDSNITKIDTIQKKFEIDLVGGLGLDSDTTLATLDNSSVTINPVAYDLFKRGRASRDREKSRNLYREAIAIEPNFAAAHSSLAINMSYGFVGKERNAMGSIEFDTFKMEALNHARYGVQIAPGDPLSHYGLAFVHYQATELDEALTSASKALDIDGNNPLSLMIMSAIKFGLGQYEEVLEVADRLRLVDPLNSSNGLTIEASAHFALTNYQTALTLSAEANDRNPNYVRAHIIMIASNWALENNDDAAWQYEELTLTDAGANLEQFLRTLPWPKEFKTKLAEIFSDINASS